MASLNSTVQQWFKNFTGIIGGTNIYERSMAPCSRGDSGTAGTGIDLTSDYSASFPIKLIRIDGSGNLGFQDIYGSDHLIEVDDKDEFSRVLIKKIYSSSDANYATTATGIHVFGD